MTERDAPMTAFKLRMREKLRRQIEESSAFNDTSINTEIVSRLEKTFAAEDKEEEAIAGREHANLVRAVHNAMRSIAFQANDEDGGYNTKQQLCAALIGIAQAVSGLKGDSLLRKVAMDSTWRDAAARAYARYADVHEFVADVMVVNPENKKATKDAERAAAQFQRPSIEEILGGKERA